jgi:hypothetical protein
MCAAGTIFMGYQGAAQWPTYASRRLRTPTDASQSPHDDDRREQMFNKTAWASVILSLVAIPSLGAISFGAAPAEAAVVYCKTAGAPQGCVVRPAAPVVAPVGVAHVGYTHVGPVTGVTHVGATRVRW